MDSAADYRARADECLRLARLSTNTVEREQYEKMASSWTDLAQSLEILRSRGATARKAPA